MSLVHGQVVADSRLLGVQGCATELFICHDFSGGCLHERRASKKDCALLVNHDDLITHRWNVCTAGRTAAEDNSDLRNSFGAHPCLVVEDSSKVVSVGEDLVLHWQKRAS